MNYPIVTHDTPKINGQVERDVSGQYAYENYCSVRMVKIFVENTVGAKHKCSKDDWNNPSSGDVEYRDILSSEKMFNSLV